jgi:hypothetical protein
VFQASWNRTYSLEFKWRSSQREVIVKNQC